MLSMKMNKRVIKLSASLMSLVMMCNAFVVDCLYFCNKNDDTEIKSERLLSELSQKLSKDNVGDIKNIKDALNNNTQGSDYTNCTKWLDKLSEYIGTLKNMNVSYKDAAEVIDLMYAYYFNNFSSNSGSINQDIQDKIDTLQKQNNPKQAMENIQCVMDNLQKIHDQKHESCNAWKHEILGLAEIIIGEINNANSLVEAILKQLGNKELNGNQNINIKNMIQDIQSNIKNHNANLTILVNECKETNTKNNSIIFNGMTFDGIVNQVKLSFLLEQDVKSSLLKIFGIQSTMYKIGYVSNALEDMHDQLNNPGKDKNIQESIQEIIAQRNMSKNNDEPIKTTEDIQDSQNHNNVTNTPETLTEKINTSNSSNSPNILANLNTIINTITNTNIYNKLPTQHYNNSDPAKIHTVRTILQGVTDIDYKEALGGSGSNSTTDTKLHESYFIPTIQSISSDYANKEISTNHINSKEEDNVNSIDNSDELNDNDNDTDTINNIDKITDIANNDINSESSLSEILLQILLEHFGKSINIENFDDIISSLSKEDIENIILELKKLKNRMKNNEAEIDDIISAFQDILTPTHKINTTDNSNIANNTNTTTDDLNTENILIDILFTTLSKHFDKTVNIDNFGDILDELSKEDTENIILELKNLKKEMNNNEKEINDLINAFQRCM